MNEYEIAVLFLVQADSPQDAVGIMNDGIRSEGEGSLSGWRVTVKDLATNATVDLVVP